MFPPARALQVSESLAKVSPELLDPFQFIHIMSADQVITYCAEDLVVGCRSTFHGKEGVCGELGQGGALLGVQGEEAGDQGRRGRGEDGGWVVIEGDVEVAARATLEDEVV